MNGVRSSDLTIAAYKTMSYLIGFPCGTYALALHVSAYVFWQFCRRHDLAPSRLEMTPERTIIYAAQQGAIFAWRNIVQQSQAARASRFRRWPLGMLAILLAILLALGFSTQSPIEGHAAPDFELTTFEGERLALAELRGKIVVLNFWASWCAPCREEAQALENVWRQYRDKDVVFVGINVKDLEQNARAFIARYGITYSNGPDRYGKISGAYRVRAFPETFLITPDGVVVKRLVGAITEGQLRAEIEALRKQPEPEANSS